MKRCKASDAIFTFLTVAVVCLSVWKGIQLWNRNDTSMSGIALRCAIVPSPETAHYPGLTTGHNYEMLKEYAQAQNDSLVSIVLAESTSSYLDSLKKGAIDLLVIPVSDTAGVDSVLLSSPIEGSTIWAIRPEYTNGINILDSWLDEYTSTDAYEDRRDLFLLRYSPSRRASSSRKTPVLSPYDELMKAYSKEIGWDWRLLAAVIYQESKFHIEARSHRGAAGLMQMRPQTATRFGAGNLLDPEESIKAGAAFLSLLKKNFRDKAADEDELRKFTLAAYNAGEGRITDCINFADYLGKDSSHWDEIVSVIPQMRDSTILQIDTVKHGIFNGYETIGYVDNVMALYEDFKTICPLK